MPKTLIFILLFIFTAGMAKGVSDTLQFHYGRSVFASLPNQEWWNPEVSWKNKYRDYDKGDTREAYLFSRSLLVWRTDAWHLAQTIETLGWVFALLLAISLGCAHRPGRAQLAGLFVMMLAAFYLGFLLLYGWLLVR
ncbi:MAG: hypothetical protein HYT31_01075 [Parcubacteria group bacterium]|nr:hypothetical protein [Parcubacteria group bacterium]